jgi:hypothetical protein
MPGRIEDDFMSAEYEGHVIATAQCSSHTAADGQEAWIVSGLPHRLFTRNQAITAMVPAERLAAGSGDEDLFVIGWREELGLLQTGSRITTALAVVAVAAAVQPPTEPRLIEPLWRTCRSCAGLVCSGEHRMPGRIHGLHQRPERARASKAITSFAKRS